MRTEMLTPCILVKNDEFWLPHVLEAVRGRFSHYVIYDVGSLDMTRAILSSFIDIEKKEADITARFMPDCPPEIQGTFRNAMIAEARNDWYMILDADEVYPSNSLSHLIAEMPRMRRAYETDGKIYGVIRRIEVTHDLGAAHGIDTYLPHHRVYHRTAFWRGTHPGEDPVYKQNDKSEFRFSKDIKLYHFHQPARSSLDEDVPKRTKRRYKATYTRGSTKPIELLRELPILNRPMPLAWPVNPELQRMQSECEQPKVLNMRTGYD